MCDNLLNFLYLLKITRVSSISIDKFITLYVEYRNKEHFYRFI